MDTRNLSRRTFNARLALAGILGLVHSAPLPGATSKKRPPLRSYPPGIFVDLHTHIDRNLLRTGAQFKFQPFIERMNEKQVAQSVILGSVMSPAGYFQESTGTDLADGIAIEKMSEYPGRLFPFCVIHPDAYDDRKKIIQELKSFRRKGVVGFGELKPRKPSGEPGEVPLDDPGMMRLYEACIEVDFPVLVHIDSKHAIDEPGLPHLRNVLQTLPELKFVAHANGWWNNISGNVQQLNGYPGRKVAPGGAVVRLLAEFPNLYGDLSANSGLNAITRDPDFGRKFLIDFQDKLLFGTDTSGSGSDERFDFYTEWKMTAGQNPWDRSFEIDPLPRPVQAKILRDNARQLLNLL